MDRFAFYSFLFFITLKVLFNSPGIGYLIFKVQGEEAYYKKFAIKGKLVFFWCWLG